MSVIFCAVQFGKVDTVLCMTCVECDNFQRPPFQVAGQESVSVAEYGENPTVDSRPSCVGVLFTSRQVFRWLCVRIDTVCVKQVAVVLWAFWSRHVLRRTVDLVLTGK